MKPRTRLAGAFVVVGPMTPRKGKHMPWIIAAALIGVLGFFLAGTFLDMHPL